jgi:hypothetical protein
VRTAGGKTIKGLDRAERARRPVRTGKKKGEKKKKAQIDKEQVGKIREKIEKEKGENRKKAQRER